MPDDSERMPRTEAVAAGPARVGEELREARLSHGVSVEQMAEHLRINRRYLDALEEGRGQDLPGQVYALGFVRSYARALGLDADDLTRRFRDGAGSQPRQRPDLVFPEPVPQRGVPAGAVILLGGVLAIGAYVGWWQWSGSGERTVDRVDAPPARLEPAARPDIAPVLPPTLGQAVPVPAGGAARPPVPPAGPPAAAPVVPPPVASPVVPALRPSGPTVAGGSLAVPQVAVAPVPGGAAPGPPPSAPTAPAPPPLAVPASPLPAEAQGRVVLRAAASSGDGAWVQVREGRTGRTVFSRVLRPGESYAVPAGDNLVLTTGKAEVLEVTVDGRASGVLSGRTGVARDVPLEVERLRAPPPPGTIAPGADAPAPAAPG